MIFFRDIVKTMKGDYMKKILFTFALLLLCAPVIACDKIPANTQVVYSPSSNYWSFGAMASDRIVLTKKRSSGTGSYSEYYCSNGRKAFQLGSNYEFIKEGMLIASHNADLKFYEVVYKNKKFKEKELDISQIQALFPDAEIIRISDFKNGVIKVKKPFFKKQLFLLWNDTDKNFHKYSYENIADSDIKGLFEAKHAGTYKFSHFGDDVYKIKVRNGF